MEWNEERNIMEKLTIVVLEWSGTISGKECNDLKRFFAHKQSPERVADFVAKRVVICAANM